MSNASDERINEILQFCMEKGEPETCTNFGINIETLHRYQREKRWRETKHPKVLLLDIETAPILAYSWGLWKQFINTQQIESDWFCLSWAARWLFSSETFSDRLTSKEAVREDDSRIIKGIWKLVDEANIVVTQNGEKFDIPRLNTRFLVSGLTPPSPYQQIDTLKALKKNFAFSSNKLDYVNQMLGLPKKIETNFELWRECVRGNDEALGKMEKYNVNDVLILEETFLKLQPWIKCGINMAVYIEAKEPCCSICGSFNMEEKGYYYTSVNRYQSFHCKDCGGYSRSRVTDVSKDERKVMLSPTAR